jgi:biotin transport system substrate-specific component
MEGALGLPVFANMQSGVHILAGPTAGYLWGFIPAAYITGFIAEKGFIKNIYNSYVACFFTTTLILVFGTIYLSVFGMGVEKALNLGFYPFLIGDIVKSGITAGLIMSFRKTP